MVNGKRMFRYENPKVIFLMWQFARQLQQSQKEKFEKFITNLKTDDYGNRRSMDNITVFDSSKDDISDMCNKIKEKHNRRDVFMMVDESSLSWLKIPNKNFNLMVACQPSAIHPLWIGPMKHVHLKRSYRCTKAIYNFIQFLMHRKNAPYDLYENVETGSLVEGEKPEIYDVSCSCEPQCFTGCEVNTSKVRELIEKRHPRDITVIDVIEHVPRPDPSSSDPSKIQYQPQLFDVRGCEYPVLIVLARGLFQDSTLIEYLTRCTSKLYVLHCGLEREAKEPWLHGLKREGVPGLREAIAEGFAIKGVLDGGT